MGQYWTRKNDIEDQDAEKTADPWAEHKVKGDRNIPENSSAISSQNSYE